METSSTGPGLDCLTEVSSPGPGTDSCACIDLYKLLLGRLDSIDQRLDEFEATIDHLESRIESTYTIPLANLAYNFPRREKELRACVIHQAGLPDLPSFRTIVENWIQDNVDARMVLVRRAVLEQGMQDLRSLPRNVISIQPPYHVRLAIAEIIADNPADRD